YMKGTIEEVVEAARGESGGGGGGGGDGEKAEEGVDQAQEAVDQAKEALEQAKGAGGEEGDEDEGGGAGGCGGGGDGDDGGVGSIGILANHAPLMAILEPTELRLYKSESDIVRFAQGEGYLQVVDNSALVLVEEAMDPDSLDRSDLETRLREARESLDQSEE